MVSTEENSLSDVTAARNALLQGGMSDAALSALVGVAPWANPKPAMAFAAKPIEAFRYGTTSPAMDELAEAALAYSHDEPHATDAGTQAPATLTLVANHDAALGEDDADESRESEEELRAAREAAVIQIEDMIEQASLSGDEEGKTRLEEILKSVKSAKTIGAIASAQSLSGQASSGKAETAEQKRERLWNKIEALQEDTRERMERLLREGKISQQDYDEWDKADKESHDPNLSDAERIKAANAAADAADKAVRGTSGDDADKVRSNSNETRQATSELDNNIDLIRSASFRGSTPASLDIDSSQAQLQAQSTPTLTAIAYNAGAQELTRPLETPAEAAAAASRGTIRRI